MRQTSLSFSLSSCEWCCEQRATCESCDEGKSEVAHGSFVHGFAYSD